MTCRESSAEIAEQARGGEPVSRPLANHLAECPRCAERWEAELELSRSLQSIRRAAAGLRSSEHARERLMAEFGERRRVRFLRSGLVWAMAAMTLLFAAGALKQMRRAGHAPAPRALQAELEFGTPEDQELLAENGFVPVPYAAPLAPGEFVEVVQRDLTPAALARMGFLIQTASANEVTTEVAVGEDGLPRAVRVPESFGVRFE